MQNYKVPKLFFSHYQITTKPPIPNEQITRVARRYLFVNLNAEQYKALMNSAVEFSNADKHWQDVKGVVLSAQATVRQLTEQRQD